MKKRCNLWVMLLFSGIIVGLHTGSAFSAQVVLQWDSVALNSARYKVYYGTSSRSYQQVLDAGINTSVAVSGLSEGATYYFAVTTFDSSNTESDFSNEIRYTIPGASQPSAPGSGGGFSSSGSSAAPAGSNSSPSATEAIASSAAQVGDYVHHFYRQILNRDCAPAERSGWAGGLMSGAFGVSDMAYGFFFSEEFLSRNLSNEAFVGVLYRAMFGREPDAGGYNGWVNSLNHGANRQDVIAGFLNSPEFAALSQSYGINAYASSLAGGGSLEDFILRFYQLFLERIPSQQEVDGWVVPMSRGAVKGAGVAQGFIFSNEFMSKNTSNEEYLSLLYSGFFNRDPDSAGFHGWLQFLNRAPLNDRATRQFVAEGFVTSAEFAQVCNRFGVDPF